MTEEEWVEEALRTLPPLTDRQRAQLADLIASPARIAAPLAA